MNSLSGINSLKIISMKQILCIALGILCLFSCKKEEYEIPSLDCRNETVATTIVELMAALDGKWLLVESFSQGTQNTQQDYMYETHHVYNQDSVEFDSLANQWTAWGWEIYEDNGQHVDSIKMQWNMEVKSTGLYRIPFA